MKKNLPKVIFFQIKKPTDKLSSITKTAAMHFAKRNPILFFVDDEKSQNYVDDLLWKEPRFSFLPHCVSEVISKELIVISQKKTNLNDARHIFNLTLDPFCEFDCSVIYELDDYTGKRRAQISKKKFKFYKERGHLIESC